MTIQKWLNSNGKRILVTCHVPEKEILCGVILLPGFSFSMCDIDYFFSRMSHVLIKNNILAIQVDPYGVGDSDGELTNVSFDTMMKDVSTVVEYAQSLNASYLFCVSRGVMCLIADNVFSTKKVFGEVIYVCPTNIEKCREICCKITRDYLWESVDCDIEKLQEEYKESVLELLIKLGAKESNILGQKINLRQIILDVQNHDYMKNSYEEFERLTFNSRTEQFVRDSKWQDEIILKIESYIISKRKKDANSS